LPVSFTGSYAASGKQQSSPLIPGVASSKVHLPMIMQEAVGLENRQGLFLACLLYGLLCRIRESAIFTADSRCGVQQGTSEFTGFVWLYAQGTVK